MRLRETNYKRLKVSRTDDGCWEVVGKEPTPGWEEPYVGRVKIPKNLSTFYVVAELARLFGEHAYTYFSYLPPKLREMLRAQPETGVLYAISRDENNQQVELRIVEKPTYQMRASLMFTDFETKRKRSSTPLTDVTLFKFKEFIKPDIKHLAFVDVDGEITQFWKNDDGSIRVRNPVGEEFVIPAEYRCEIAASLLTLQNEQLRYWEFVNNVRREAIETVVDSIENHRTEFEQFLLSYIEKRGEEGRKYKKLLPFLEKEDWLEELKDFFSARPKMVEPVLIFAAEKGLDKRANDLLRTLETGREVWRHRVKSLRPIKVVIPEFDPEEPAVSFWNEPGKIPKPRMRFGSYFIKESAQNPIPVLFLLSIFEPD